MSAEDSRRSGDLELQRSRAVVGLALLRVPVAEVFGHAVHLLAGQVPESVAALYLVDGDSSTLVAVAGGEVPLERADAPGATTGVPGGLAGASVELTLSERDGRPAGVLRLSAPALQTDDLALAGDVASVVEGALQRDRLEQSLRHNEARMVEAQRISHVGSYDFEIATGTNTWSDQLYRIYGLEPQSLNATYEVFLSMLHPDDRDHVVAVHQHSLETLEPYEMEERIVWPDGEVRILASWGEIVPDADGRPARMVGICWDITDRREMEAQLVREALHDRLTGLPNRALLTDRLSQALSGLRRHGRTLAVLFIDLDRFKVINDSLGHDAGDEVIVEVARRLEKAMRPGDTLARFGADEFVVVCEDLDHPAQAMSVASALQEVVNAPMHVRGSEVVITVSTGIALPSGEQGDGPEGSESDSAIALLRDADAAMYRAKKDGRARSVVFADALRVEAMDRLDTETQLRRALIEGELRVHYQPIVDVASGEMSGVEALVRWEHPTRGLVPPMDFIPIAEETGLVVPLGEWVLEQACEQLVAWHRTRPDLSVAVNLSGLQIALPDLAGRIRAVLDRTGVDPTRVQLEITETVLMHDAAATLDVLRSLKELGVQVSVDDFGTGYSSLSYLKRYPVDTLKIDRSFVDGLGQDPEDSAIVRAVQVLAGSLGMTTVAEGVETAMQLEVLRGLGCTRAQGFLFQRPVPADEVMGLG